MYQINQNLKKIILNTSLFLGLILLPTGFASERIVGGRDAQIEEVPWQVYLSLGCGATILSETWVITAEHCVSGGGNGITIKAGITKLSENSTSFNIKRVLTPPGGGDIALVELDAPLTLGPKVMAIGFATEADADAGLTDPGVMATVSGWGLTSEFGNDASDQLQLVEVPIVSLADANTGSAYGGQIGEKELPAGFSEGGKDACQGDSGGPLVVPDRSGSGVILAGVVSWGDGCARPDKYGIYARVSYHAQWIQDETGLVGSVEQGNFLSVRTQGKGTVVSEGIINCGSDCSENFEDSTKTVSLIATPDQGWTFDSWAGACESNTNVCEVLVNESQSVTAIFTNASVFQSITLMDANSDEDIMVLETTNLLSLDDLPNDITLNTKPNESVSSVKYTVTGGTDFTRTDSFSPFSMQGENSGNFLPWEHQAEAGEYVFTISAYSETQGGGELLGVTKITITFFDGPVSTELPVENSLAHNISVRDKTIHFHSPYDEPQTGVLYSIMGRKVFQWTNIQKGPVSLELPENVKKGVYYFGLQHKGTFQGLQLKQLLIK